LKFADTAEVNKIELMIRLFAFLVLLLPFAAAADNFEEAVAAYTDADYEKAYQLWRPLAEKGDGGAMFDLGVLYWDGKGIPRNPSLAIDWWKKAAEQNVAAAQYNLGLAYYLGTGVDRDIKMAISLMHLAVQQGHDFAAGVLSRLEQDFESVTESDKVLFAYSGSDIGVTAATLYTGPSFQKEIFGNLNVGTPIRVLSSEAAWARIEVPDGIRLWVYGKYIVSDGSQQRVTGTGVRMRTTPTKEKSSAIVGALSEGAVIEVTKVWNDWKEIRAPSSIAIWIPSVHVRLIPEVNEEWQEEWQAIRNLRVTQSVIEADSMPTSKTPKDLLKPDAVTNSLESETISTNLLEDLSSSPEITINFRAAAVSAQFAEVVGNPNEPTQLLKLLTQHTPVKIIEKQDEWARVKVPTGLYVWIYGDYLNEVAGEAVINKDYVRVRSLPSTKSDSAVLGIFSKGSKVVFINRQGDWKRIKAIDSVTGWIRLDQLTILDSATKKWQEKWAAYE